MKTVNCNNQTKSYLTQSDVYLSKAPHDIFSIPAQISTFSIVTYPKSIEIFPKAKHYLSRTKTLSTHLYVLQNSIGWDVGPWRTHPSLSSGYEIGLGDNKIHNLAARGRNVQPYRVVPQWRLIWVIFFDKSWVKQVPT